MPFRVMLVDDHKVLRDGLKAVLARESEFIVAGEADCGIEAVRVCKQVHPDVVLMDISLPGINGIEATTDILRECPRARIVMLSMHGDEDLILDAIRSGARGFVLKKASAREVLEAIRVVAQGGTYLTANISDVLLARLQRGEPAAAGRDPLELLSPREAQVLRLIAEGKGSKEVAVVLGLEHNTVRSYRKTMMKKLGVNNLASLIHVAMAAGIIHSKPERKMPTARSSY
jgi:DNA-binding NarL/FixJ family response regulator